MWMTKRSSGGFLGNRSVETVLWRWKQIQQAGLDPVARPIHRCPQPVETNPNFPLDADHKLQYHNHRLQYEAR